MIEDAKVNQQLSNTNYEQMILSSSRKSKKEQKQEKGRDGYLDYLEK